MTGPTIEFLLLAPILAVLVGAVLSVGVEALCPRKARFIVQTALSLVTLGTAVGFVVRDWHVGVRQIAAEGAVALDEVAIGGWLLVLGFAIVAVVLAAERRVGGGKSSFTPMAAAVPGSPTERAALSSDSEHTEIFPLLLFATSGMLIFSAANDFITAFVGLEILSLPLYLLCGLARRHRLLSHEAALKYFLLGALSSAIFLYGVALIYGYAHSFEYRDVAAAIAELSGSEYLLLAGFGLIAIGLLFKVGVVPFHSWVPDVYTGAPTPISAFMAVCTKIAGIGALMRILYVAFGGLLWSWQLPLAILAVASMALGAFFGLTQKNVKRMLAYSSIAHVGFLLVGVIAAATASAGLLVGGLGSTSITWFYLLAYGLATAGAFAVVMCVRTSSGENAETSAWAGFGRRNPLLGAAMTVFLLSLAGIPLTGGFIGKVYAFTLGWRNGFAWLVVVALALSLVTAAFYMRLVWTMFGSDPTPDAQPVKASPGLAIVIFGAALLTLVLGIVPSLGTDLASHLAVFLR